MELSVKIGLGVGAVTVLHVGGEQGRREYVAVGDPLVQAFAAEHHGVSGEVVVAPEAWTYVKRHFRALDELPDGFAKLDCSPDARYDAVRGTSIHKVLDKLLEALDEDPDAEARLEKRLRCYIPESALPSLTRDGREDEKWANELRTVVVMFVNLGLGDRELLDATRYVTKRRYFRCHVLQEDTKSLVHRCTNRSKLARPSVGVVRAGTSTERRSSPFELILRRT